MTHGPLLRKEHVMHRHRTIGVCTAVRIASLSGTEDCSAVMHRRCEVCTVGALQSFTSIACYMKTNRHGYTHDSQTVIVLYSLRKQDGEEHLKPCQPQCLRDRK